MPDPHDRPHARDFDTADVERVLEQVASLPAPERAAFLRTECADRPGLQAEVLSLLGHAEAAQAFFERLDVHVPESVAALVGTVLPPPEDIPSGSRIGRYRVLERLGAGGMGAVYRAYDESLDRDVALKLVHEVADTAEGRPFLAMTCYRGETLKDQLDRGAIPVGEALALAREIVRGLAAAHERGVVHRDVKPGNVMLVDDGSVKILDFGIAKVADGTQTVPGVTPGTVAYMSPEQARGEEVDHRSDLWSMGVVLYEMIAGQRPLEWTEPVPDRCVVLPDPESANQPGAVGDRVGHGRRRKFGCDQALGRPVRVLVTVRGLAPPPRPRAPAQARRRARSRTVAPRPPPPVAGPPMPASSRWRRRHSA
jgi:serine/threonine protein kinase